MKFIPHEYQRYATEYIKTIRLRYSARSWLGKTVLTRHLIDLLFDSFEAHRILVIALR